MSRAATRPDVHGEGTSLNVHMWTFTTVSHKMCQNGINFGLSTDRGEIQGEAEQKR
jgi:hypothetical protein